MKNPILQSIQKGRKSSYALLEKNGSIVFRAFDFENLITITTQMVIDEKFLPSTFRVSKKNLKKVLPIC
jgi:hypothetical protein